MEYQWNVSHFSCCRPAFPLFPPVSCLLSILPALSITSFSEDYCLKISKLQGQTASPSSPSSYYLFQPPQSVTKNAKKHACHVMKEVYRGDRREEVCVKPKVCKMGVSFHVCSGTTKPNLQHQNKPFLPSFFLLRVQGDACSHAVMRRRRGSRWWKGKGVRDDA